MLCMVTFEELLEELLSVVRANEYVTSMDDLRVQLTEMEAAELAEDLDTDVDYTSGEQLGQATGLDIKVANRNEIVKPDGEVVTI